jgi:hypothetical protein
MWGSINTARWRMVFHHQERADALANLPTR